MSLIVEFLGFFVTPNLQIETSKVQMDVIKPWVATRVTELLGFEDEVLINFIYGMLEEKVGAQYESSGHHIFKQVSPTSLAWNKHIL